MSAVAAAVVGGAALVGGATVGTALLVGGATALAAGSAERKAQKAANTAAGKQAEAAETLAGQADRAAELSYGLGQQQLGLGREQLAFTKQQYAEMSPLARRVAEAQIAAQEEQMRQARDYYDYQVQTFRPLEKGLVADAQSFSTERYREQLAAQAAEDAARAFDTTQGMASRDLARRGVSPNSGAALAMSNQNMLGLASARAGASTSTRERAEQLGWARRLDAAGLGRNLAGASTAAYQSATGAGSAGINSAMAPGNQFTQGMGQAANIYGQGANTIMAGSGQAMNAYGQLYGGANTASINAQNNLAGLQGALLGTAGTLGAKFIA